MRKLSVWTRLVRMQLLQQFFTPRLVVIFVGMLLVSMRIFMPLVRFAQGNGVGISPLGGVVFFFGTFQALFLNSLVLGLEVFLFAGAPFLTDEQNVCLLRCGRGMWISAQLATLFLMALLSMLMWVACIFAVLLPVADWSLEWGRVWRTLCYSLSSQSISVPLDMAPYILHNYAPLEAFLYSCALKLLVFTLIGYVVYLGNLLSRAALGTALGMVLALEDAFFVNELWSWLMWLSPATMSRLYMLEKVFEYQAPSPVEAIALMSLYALILALGTRWLGPRRLEA